MLICVLGGHGQAGGRKNKVTVTFTIDVPGGRILFLLMIHLLAPLAMGSQFLCNQSFLRDTEHPRAEVDLKRSKRSCCHFELN